MAKRRPISRFRCGRLAGALLAGSLNLVQEGLASAQYKFEPIGGGMHAIVCVDVTKYGLD